MPLFRMPKPLATGRIDMQLGEHVGGSKRGKEPPAFSARVDRSIVVRRHQKRSRSEGVHRQNVGNGRIPVLRQKIDPTGSPAQSEP